MEIPNIGVAVEIKNLDEIKQLINQTQVLTALMQRNIESISKMEVEFKPKINN